MMKNLLLSACLVLLLTGMAFPQTFVSGGIYSNTSWTVSGSPYIVTGNLTLFPGNSLTIEPGVRVEFYDSVFFEVRGDIVAVGTEDDSITFCGYQNSANDEWMGININHELGGNGSFHFCRLENSRNGISNNMGMDPHMDFIRCYFFNNYCGISGYAADYKVLIDSCLFYKNVRAITGADRIITNCVFNYNEYGTYQVERMNISNCIFCGNQVGLNGQGILTNSVVTRNRVGSESGDLYNFFINTGNYITDNDTGIVYAPFFSGGSSTLGINNIICNNNFYNIVYKNAGNMSVVNNCWCETDSLSISEKIYDGYDNPAYGLLILSPWTDCNSSVIPDTNYCTPVTGTSKIVEKHPFVRVYPNPFSDHCTIETEGITHGATVTIRDVTGRVVRTYEMTGTSIRIDRADLRKGIYLYSVRPDEGAAITGKIIVN